MLHLILELSPEPSPSPAASSVSSPGRLPGSLFNAPAPGQVPANDPITVSDEEESCSMIDVQSSPEAASPAFRQDVLDLTGSPSPHPAAHLVFQPAVQPAAQLAFQAAAQPIQQEVTDLTGSLSPQTFGSISPPPVARLVFQPATKHDAQLTPKPLTQLAAQPAPQSASAATVGQGLLYTEPPDWDSASDHGSPIQAAKKAAQAAHTTWCPTRLIILAMYLVVGAGRLSNKGVCTYDSVLLSLQA